MPAVDPKSGSCFICLITTFLFICVAGGGSLLAIYITKPDASSLYSIAGISLVCLPWLFWFLTFLYRLLSRRFGFRMDCFGASDDSVPTSTSAANGSGDRTELEAGTAGGSPITRESSPARNSHESQAPLRQSMAS